MTNSTNGQLNGQAAIIRTGRGLTIAGTRTTLYRIMDYVKAGWPAKLIRDRLNLNDKQIAEALAYIDKHRDEVEAEYQQVVTEGEERRREWEETRREILAQALTDKPLNPREATLREKLAEAKARLGME